MSSDIKMLLEKRLFEKSRVLMCSIVSDLWLEHNSNADGKSSLKKKISFITNGAGYYFELKRPTLQLTASATSSEKEERKKRKKDRCAPLFFRFLVRIFIFISSPAKKKFFFPRKRVLERKLLADRACFGPGKKSGKKTRRKKEKVSFLRVKTRRRTTYHLFLVAICGSAAGLDAF